MIGTIRLAVVSAAFAAIATLASAQTAAAPGDDAALPGKAVYDKACAACHDHPETSRAPSHMVPCGPCARPASSSTRRPSATCAPRPRTSSAGERAYDLEAWLANGQPDNSGWLQRAQCKGAAARIDRDPVKPGDRHLGPGSEEHPRADGRPVRPDETGLPQAATGLGRGPAADADHALAAGDRRRHSVHRRERCGPHVRLRHQDRLRQVAVRGRRPAASAPPSAMANSAPAVR